uniref:Uncharacterized protein n=1 Tax=viral metagenome TaxID=1070528 RepID=A0A6C0F9B6_9ZZZZ
MNTNPPINKFNYKSLHLSLKRLQSFCAYLARQQSRQEFSLQHLTTYTKPFYFYVIYFLIFFSFLHSFFIIYFLSTTNNNNNACTITH